MAVDQPGESPMETAAGAVGSHTAEALEVLANETRLAALLALWEEYEAFADDNSVSFGTLRQRVGMRDSGQFHYHLDRLTGVFVERTDEGYALSNAGQNLVRAVISGIGTEEPTFETTVDGLECPVCAESLSFNYEDGHVVGECQACGDGPSDSGESANRVFQRFSFDPAGVMGRSPIETLEANGKQSMWQTVMRISGVCPECSGAVEGELRVCDDHDDGHERCSACGCRNRLMMRMVCTVCKDAMRMPPHCIAELHPKIMSHLMEVFDYGYGLEADDSSVSYDDLAAMEDPVESDTELVSESPPRVRVEIDCDPHAFVVTLDENGKFVAVEKLDGPAH